MNVVDILTSINKISLIAFVLVFAGLMYEITLLRKSRKRKGKPVVPQFNMNTQVKTQAPKLIIPTAAPKKSALKNSRRLGIFFVLGTVIVLMVAIFIISRAIQGNPGEKQTSVQPLKTKAQEISPTVQTISSVPTVTPTTTQKQLVSPTESLMVSPQETVSPGSVLPSNSVLQTNPTISVTVSASPSISISPTSTLLAQVSPTLNPTVTSTDTVNATTLTPSVQPSPSIQVSPTGASTLPVTGNTSFTMMAIGISGIIVLLSFVF